jgi:hypothetical protein
VQYLHRTIRTYHHHTAAPPPTPGQALRFPPERRIVFFMSPAWFTGAPSSGLFGGTTVDLNHIAVLIHR